MLRLVGLAVIASAYALDISSERAAMIAKIQETPGVQWQAAPVDRFAHEPIGIGLQPLMGVTAEAMSEREEFAKRAPLYTSSDPIPESFDSETNWPQCAKVIGDIRDQSACGCCWAFAAASAASDRLCISTNATVQVPLSAEDICFCASSNGCGGGDIHTPWRHMKFSYFFGGPGAVTGGQYQGTGPFGAGMCSDFSLPHCHHHGPQGQDPFPAEGTTGCPNVKTSPSCPSSCDSTSNSPHSDFKADKYGFSGGDIFSASGADQIARVIMRGGPVETAFTVYSDFENYAGGIYHHVTGDAAGGHAVRIVGWGVENGQKYWKVANSWNPYWGEKGYFRIRRGNNEGGIESQVTASIETAKWGKKSDLMKDVVV